MSLTNAALVKRAVEVLETVPVENAVREARLLVAEATGIAVDRLTLELREAASDAQSEALEQMLKRRLNREPVSHILGRRAFFQHEFEVTADTLDPRPETEVIVLEALRERFSHFLDMGTGTGAIAISLLAARPKANGVASDLSDAALQVATRNAHKIGVADRLSLITSDWYADVSGRFDLIVSNPPYIAASEMAGLAPELRHEPRMALTDEDDGLTAYRAICAGAPAHLEAGGHLMVEIGWQQGDAVAQLMRDSGLVDVRVIADLDGRDRVVRGQKAQ